MLTEVLGHLHNYFEVSAFPGTYTIAGGGVDSLPPSLAAGQYIRIAGSVLNDGVYRLPLAADSGMVAETFDGCIFGLAVPGALLDLVSEIETWCAGDAGQATGYASESFGGYSYSRATGPDGAPLGWQGVFRSRLNQWRKV